MSVLQSKRGESPVQFLETARQLEIYAIKQCVKIPKRYTFYIAVRTSNHACDVYDYVKKANSIFPSTAEAVAMRRRYFTEAKASLQALISQLEVIKEMNIAEIEDKCWIRLETLIGNEFRLVDKVMKSDAAIKF